MSSYNMYLITIKYNAKHYTSNLLSRNKDILVLVKDMRIIIKLSLTIFILVRSYNIEDLIIGLINCFYELAYYNLISNFFIDLINALLLNTGVKLMNDLPKFTALL